MLDSFSILAERQKRDPHQENSRTSSRTITIKELRLPPIVLVLLLDLLLRAHTRIAQKRVPRAAPNARQALASHLSPLTLTLTRSPNGGARGIFLDQRDKVVGGILDGGNVGLRERLICGEFLAHVV